MLALMVHAGDAAALSGTARAVDGDTLDLAGERIRLFGIDAPEHDQSCQRGETVWACGDWSRATLSDLVAGQDVTCDGTDRDRYGRLVARCSIGGRDLGQAMVEAGAARAYRRFSTRYVGVETRARAAARGIWSGEMQEPETFRHGRPDAAPAPGPETESGSGCRIKGNISSNGRIYHLPGQEHYAETQISPARGEAWFCTEAEAAAAGFRPARR